MENNEMKKIAMRVSLVSIIVNVILSALKLIAGFFGHSAAMISDAVHSLSDVISTFIVMLGINIASKASDNSHQYGHERFECIASILLSGALFATGIGIGYKGITNIISGRFAELEIPETMALAAAVISIISKELMFHYTKLSAKKINSGSLMADAWHHRSDALSSVGSFIGIFGARMGYPVFDSAASVVISLFIIKAAYDIFCDSINKLVDSSCDEETINNMKTVINQQNGVLSIDELKTRLFGSKVYVDIEISADASITLAEAHSIAETVHDQIEKNFENVKHCMVHVNPK